MRVELGVEDVVKDRSMKVSYDTWWINALSYDQLFTPVIRSLMSDAGVHLNLQVHSSI